MTADVLRRQAQSYERLFRLLFDFACCASLVRDICPGIPPWTGAPRFTSIDALGRNEPHLSHGKSLIDRLFGCGNRRRLAVRLARDNFASNRRGPRPLMDADVLHERVFDLSIFYHSADAIAVTGTVGDRSELVTFQSTGCFDPFPWPTRLGHALQTDLLKLLRLRRILSVL